MGFRTLVALAFLSATAYSQVVAPPLPKTYHVDLRYRIEADRDGRAVRFRAMMAELKALGFVADEREDADLDILDPNADRLAGTIGSDKLPQLLKTIAVQSVLVRPSEQAWPTDKPVQVKLGLATGLDPLTQRKLHEQVEAQLVKLGFVPAQGYDDRDFSTLRGSIPANQAMNLLKDIRGLPAGWLLQTLPRQKLPQPLASLQPIRLVEVLPEMEPNVPLTLPPAASAKLASGLRAALVDPEFAAKPFRVEAAFAQPIGDQRQYRVQLGVQLPGIAVEGIVGSLVTFEVPNAKMLEALAARPEILSLRRPPSATNTVLNVAAAGDALSATHIVDLQKKGYRGQGKKLIVLGGAFDTARLPKNAVYLDLTAELSSTFDPQPLNTAFDATAAAIAAHKAAPDATLIVIRIEPTAFHQLSTVAKAVLGDLTLSTSQVARAEVLLADYEVLTRRRDLINQEYAEAFGNLSDDDRPRLRREQAAANMEKLKAEEASFRTRHDKYQLIRKGLEACVGAVAVANTLVWDDGYAGDGLSEFAQFIDEHFTPNRSRKLAPTWAQAASESTWSVWAGPAFDTDGDRVLDFAGVDTPLPKGSWTRELNFLGALKDNGIASTLAGGTKLRIAIQWREPHDPAQPLGMEPHVNFTLQLLRQIDPTGTKTATDELVEVAASEGTVVRVLKTPSCGVYEQTLDVTLPADGRYALRVKITSNVGNRFGSETRLAEVSPKITLRSNGDRTVFTTFNTPRPGVGVPGDARAAFTVGRADAQGRSMSLLGAGPGLQLRAKPDALLFGEGSGTATATVAGLAADLADGGVRPSQFVGTSAIQNNGMLVLPLEWIGR